MTVVAAAAASIDAGREAGRTFRTDGFFDTTPGDRAAAEEVAEAVLRAAQDEPEERKLPYLARLLSEIAFRPNVDRATASMLVRIGHELTYRQLLLLSLYARKDLFPFPPGNFRDKGLRHMDAVVPLLHDSMDLHARGLVAITGGFALGILDIEPNKMTPSGAGVWLYDLMGLVAMPPDELHPVFAALFGGLGGEVVGSPGPDRA